MSVALREPNRGPPLTPHPFPPSLHLVPQNAIASLADPEQAFSSAVSQDSRIMGRARRPGGAAGGRFVRVQDVAGPDELAAACPRAGSYFETGFASGDATAH